MSDSDKKIEWVGSSLEDLTGFPADAKQIAGHQLRLVQKGKTPDHYRPMPQVGAGTTEIIVETGDAFRVFYVASFPEAVYVLHAFQKTTQHTSKNDINKGSSRYRAVLAKRELLRKREKHAARKQKA